jgi:hypothetical protein
VSDSRDSQVKGITLSVYLYVARRNNPVGPRDVMKGLNLSSPSVAYRHLEKLEDRGLIKKNNYGEYVSISRARLRGYIWIGNRIFPKFFVYSAVFLSILIFEAVVLAVHYAVEDFSFLIFFVLLTLITGSAMLVFAVEGFLQRKQLRKYSPSE